MTEIGFYHLTRSTLEQALPRLLEKVYGSGQRAVLRVGSAERLEALDRHLWSYANDSFLPHGTKADGHREAQPIYLTLDEDNPTGATLLVLVDGAPMGDIAAYGRVLDLFDGSDEAAVARARERWKTCRAGGHKLVYWRQDERGAWVKAQESA